MLYGHKKNCVRNKMKLASISSNSDRKLENPLDFLLIYRLEVYQIVQIPTPTITTTDKDNKVNNLR